MTSPTSNTPAPALPASPAPAAPAKSARGRGVGGRADPPPARPPGRRPAAAHPHHAEPGHAALRARSGRAAWSPALPRTGPAGRLLGGALLFAAAALDCRDGQLARSARSPPTAPSSTASPTTPWASRSAWAPGAYMAATFGSPWYWLLALLGIASSAVQLALFDHTSSRYIARAGAGHPARRKTWRGPGRTRPRLARTPPARRAAAGALLQLLHGAARRAADRAGRRPRRLPRRQRRPDAGRRCSASGPTLRWAVRVAHGLVLVRSPAVVVYFALCTTLLNLDLVVLMRLAAAGGGVMRRAALTLPAAGDPRLEVAGLQRRCSASCSRCRTRGSRRLRSPPISSPWSPPTRGSACASSRWPPSRPATAPVGLVRHRPAQAPGAARGHRAASAGAAHAG